MVMKGLNSSSVFSSWTSTSQLSFQYHKLHLKYLWRQQIMVALKTWVWKQPWMLFLSAVCEGVWGSMERESSFSAFSSLVQVKFIPELYTWKRKGWKCSSCGNTFYVIPSLHRGCKSCCLIRKVLSLPAPGWHPAQSGKSHLERGKVFFWIQKTYFTLFGIFPPPIRPTNICIGPQRDGNGWADHWLCNQIKLHS